MIQFEQIRDFLPLKYMVWFAGLLLFLLSCIYFPSWSFVQKSTQELAELKEQARIQAQFAPYFAGLQAREKALREMLKVTENVYEDPQSLTEILTSLQSIATESALIYTDFVPQAESVLTQKNFIIKATVHGSVYAIRDCILSLSVQPWVLNCEDWQLTAADNHLEVTFTMYCSYIPSQKGDEQDATPQGERHD